MKQDLRELAQRVMDIREPSYEIDRAIFGKLWPLGAMGDLPRSFYTIPIHAPSIVPRFRSSLDAAKALVPEGWLICSLSELGLAGGCSCRLGNPNTSKDVLVDQGARELAATLCAAALLARAGE